VEDAKAQSENAFTLISLIFANRKLEFIRAIRVKEKINNLFFLKKAWIGLERLGTAWNGLIGKFSMDEDF